VYVASNIDLQPSKKLNFSSFAGVLSIHNAHQYNSHGHFGGALEWYYYLFGFFAFSDYFFLLPGSEIFGGCVGFCANFPLNIFVACKLQKRQKKRGFLFCSNKDLSVPWELANPTLLKRLAGRCGKSRE